MNGVEPPCENFHGFLGCAFKPIDGRVRPSIPQGETTRNIGRLGKIPVFAVGHGPLLHRSAFYRQYCEFFPYDDNLPERGLLLGSLSLKTIRKPLEPGRQAEELIPVADIVSDLGR